MCENTGMSFESGCEGVEPLGASGRHGGADAVRPGGVDASAAVIVANSEQLSLDGVDLQQVRGVLARLGAEGSRSLEGLGAEETLSLLTGVQTLSSALAAVQARALVQLERAITSDCQDRGETPGQARRIARAETSLALKTSPSAAGQSLATSRRLVHSMPGMLAALARGRIVPASAHQVAKTMAPAEPASRQQVDEILSAHLAYLEDCGPGQWADEAERVLHGLDPSGSGARHERARRERSVTVRRGRHGMATITAHVTALDGARIRKGLSVAAEQARAAGDRRGHQQIMADRFADALIGRGDGIDPSTLEIGVLVTDRSLLAPRHADPATVEGHGAVPFDHVRAEMLDRLRTVEDGDEPDLALTLRRLFLNCETGQLGALESRSRQFPPALARLIRAAHQTCRAPHCDAPIRQIDHIVPHAQNGSTSFDNANGLCAACNQKEEAGQRAAPVVDEQGRRRTVEWTSRYGQKARRGGINFDPLGTAHRLPHAHRPPDIQQPPDAHRLPDIERQPDIQQQPAAEHALAESIDQIGAAFELNFALIDPHPPGADPSPPPSTPRRDFLVLPT